MSVILAFDTTHGNCSIVISDIKGIPLLHKEYDHPDRQAELLLPLIDDAFKQLQLEINTISAIGVTTGPGSFTGIRIGLAAARGLGLSLSKPVIGISSFEAILWQEKKENLKEYNAVIIDAKRGQLYSQLFDHNYLPIDEPQMMDYQQISHYLSAYPKIKIIGNASLLIEENVITTLPNIAENLFRQSNAVGVINSSCDKIHQAVAQDFPAVALYIREPDAKLPGHFHKKS